MLSNFFVSYDYFSLFFSFHFISFTVSSFLFIFIRVFPFSVHLRFSISHVKLPKLSKKQKGFPKKCRFWRITYSEFLRTFPKIIVTAIPILMIIGLNPASHPSRAYFYTLVTLCRYFCTVPQ